MKGFPLKANLVFEISFKVDPHQSGIATIKARGDQEALALLTGVTGVFFRSLAMTMSVALPPVP